MKPYEIKCLIFIIISILYLYSNSYKKETFANLDTFIQNTNNGNWNFNSYNPYANLNEYIDSFYIISTDIDTTYMNSMSYNERLEKYKQQLNNLKDDNSSIKIKPLIENKLNTYNNTTNIRILDDPKITKFGLKYTYKVPLVTAFDKLNYVKNKAKLKNLINTSLIKDLRTSFINKYIKNGTITNQPDGEGNINVELKYSIENDMRFTTTRSYNTNILKKIKDYLKMDIQDNGTTIGDGEGDNKTILIYFKIITYNLDETNKEIITKKVKNLHNILFTDLLNTNDTNNILEKMTRLVNDNEDYIKNICIWKSGLCKKRVLLEQPVCSIPSGDKNKLNTYVFKPTEDTLDEDKIVDKKTDIITHINDKLIAKTTPDTRICINSDIDYNKDDNTFTFNLYDTFKHTSDTDILTGGSKFKKWINHSYNENIQNNSLLNNNIHINEETYASIEMDEKKMNNMYGGTVTDWESILKENTMPIVTATTLYNNIFYNVNNDATIPKNQEIYFKIILRQNNDLDKIKINTKNLPQRGASKTYDVGTLDTFVNIVDVNIIYLKFKPKATSPLNTSPLNIIITYDTTATPIFRLEYSEIKIWEIEFSTDKKEPVPIRDKIDRIVDDSLQIKNFDPNVDTLFTKEKAQKSMLTHATDEYKMYSYINAVNDTVNLNFRRKSICDYLVRFNIGGIYKQADTDRHLYNEGDPILEDKKIETSYTIVAADMSALSSNSIVNFEIYTNQDIYQITKIEEDPDEEGLFTSNIPTTKTITDNTYIRVIKDSNGLSKSEYYKILTPTISTSSTSSTSSTPLYQKFKLYNVEPTKSTSSTPQAALSLGRDDYGVPQPPLYFQFVIIPDKIEDGIIKIGDDPYQTNNILKLIYRPTYLPDDLEKIYKIDDGKLSSINTSDEINLPGETEKTKFNELPIFIEFNPDDKIHKDNSWYNNGKKRTNNNLSINSKKNKYYGTISVSDTDPDPDFFKHLGFRPILKPIVEFNNTSIPLNKDLFTTVKLIMLNENNTLSELSPTYKNKKIEAGVTTYNYDLNINQNKGKLIFKLPHRSNFKIEYNLIGNTWENNNSNNKITSRDYITYIPKNTRFNTNLQTIGPIEEGKNSEIKLKINGTTFYNFNIRWIGVALSGFDEIIKPWTVDNSGSQCNILSGDKNNIDNYMNSLQNIKGLDPIMQDKVKSILLADLDPTAFNNYTMGKSTKDINKYKKLRLYGKVYKLLDKYKNIDIITNAIKTELDLEEEVANDITKPKLYAVLHLIIEQHLRNSNEEFKLNELLLTNNNNSTKKRYEVILDYIPKTDETKSMKLKEMSSLEKVKYFDKTTKGINKIELELQLIETMNNDELTAYFNDINTLYKTQDVDKDVNARLKRLITKNKNNIIRIHRKLHAISGGLIKQTGGDLILKDETTVDISPDNTDTLLLLHDYKNYSLNIPLNINGVAKYNDKLYIIGNSGYLATYDLNTGLAKSTSVNPSKGANLNSISINSNGICVIVGNNGTLLYRNLDTNESFKAKSINDKSNLNEVFVDATNVYIAGDNILYKDTYTRISTDGTTINKITTNVPNAKYFNIIDHESDFYCMGKATNAINGVAVGDIVIYNLDDNSTNVIKSIDSVSSAVLTPLFLRKDDDKLKLIYKKTDNSTHICIITPENSDDDIVTSLVPDNIKEINIPKNSTTKIDTCFIERSVLFIIAITKNEDTDAIETKFYDYTIIKDTNTLTPSTDPSDRFKILSKTVFNNKITHLASDNFDSSINLLHYGSGGNIFNYSMNTKYKDFSLILTGTTANIYPKLSGLDKKNNNVYIIDNIDKNNKDYTIKTGISDWEDKGIRLEGDNNSIILKSSVAATGTTPAIPGIRLIKYDYNAEDIKDNTTINSIKTIGGKNEPIKIDKISNKYILKTNKLSMTINSNTGTNKNEFVSVALVINHTFKIWLKPENEELNYKYIYDFDEISDEICQLYKYRNGKFMDYYNLDFSEINNSSSTDILFISYNDKLQNYDSNTNILDLGEASVPDNYSIKFELGSNNAYIIFESNRITDGILQLSRKKETIEFSVVNGNEYKHYKINLNYGTVVKSSDLNLFESRYLLHLSINEAYDYLNQVNKDERTIAFLIRKYDLDKKDDVQQFLNLILDKSKRATIESGLINSLNNADRQEYIKKYMVLKNIPVVPTTKTSDTKSAVTEKDIMLNNLKLKLDKMRIEKEILANRYKVEQQNKVLAQRSTNLVKKTDMTKLDKEMDKISGVLNKADTDKSDSFFDKVFSIFSSDEDKKKKDEEKIKKTKLELIKEARAESLKNPSNVEYDKLKKEKSDLQKMHDELKKKTRNIKKRTGKKNKRT